ncbi:hypothetical protein D9756_001141 [Leucocoprinus leucothites]|uniref:F-box domain-containing protein n=1 Tax=Leucocoprinus leucothites TaxID=201217 RepID=A0A8H5LNP0_9AGAR|nr:hypothetical protein D9756_001141 [Leucoagaricus leucothites]
MESSDFLCTAHPLETALPPSGEPNVCCLSEVHGSGSYISSQYRSVFPGVEPYHNFGFILSSRTALCLPDPVDSSQILPCKAASTVMVHRMTTDLEPTIVRATLIRTFPTEMLASIFYFYFLEEELSGRGSCIDLHDARVTFRLVCKRWDRIIQSTPQLWTFVVVDYDLCLEEPPSPPVSYYQDWLQRSKALPITLRICTVDDDCAYCEEENQHFGEILEILWTSVSRWERLILIDLPSLDSRDTIEYFTQALADIPHLQSLTWMDFCGFMTVSMIKYMPCNDLTELSLEFDETLSLKPALDLIRGLPSLMSLTLTGDLLDYGDDDEFDGNELPQIPVHLPHLRFLDISFEGLFCGDFLQLMYCPNLISFIISPTDSLYPKLVSKVFEFVGRHTAVKKLKMEKFPKDEIVPFFHTGIFQLNRIPVIDVHIYNVRSSYGADEEPVNVDGVIDIMKSGEVEMRDGWLVKASKTGVVVCCIDPE